MVRLIAEAVGIKQWLVWLIGGVALTLAAVAGVWAYGSSKYASGYEAGQRDERIVWEELRKKMLLQMDQKRREAQKLIDEAERKYHESTKDAAAAREELEKVIEEHNDETGTSTGSSGNYIPRGVSRSLDKVGR